MSENNDFIIHIKGLKNGKQSFEYKIEEDFFTDFGNTQILDASILSVVEVEKGSGWIKVVCNINGFVVTECDRCLDDLKIPVDITANMAVKFAKSTELSDDTGSSNEFMIVDPSDGELDLKQFIYDYICTSLPLQRVHKEGECNKEMIKRLNNAVQGESKSQFGNLKQMLDKEEKNI